MISHSPQETYELAKKIAAHLKPGDVLVLKGELGAGKTHFVKGLAQGLYVKDVSLVHSPTFTLINEYQGRMPLYHFDFYRIQNREEAEFLGLEEYFEAEGVCVIEWGDKFPSLLLRGAYRIEFKVIDETTREISIPREFFSE